MKHKRFLPFRICLLVFGVSILVTVLHFVLFTDGTKDKMIKSNSPDFQYNLYAGKIFPCPCSTSEVPHSAVLSIEPQYHPICSSELVSSSYRSQLFEKGDNVSLLLNAHYQVLASMAKIIRTSVFFYASVFFHYFFSFLN